MLAPEVEGRPWSEQRGLDDAAYRTQLAYLFERSVHRQAQVVEVELLQPGTLMVDGDLIEGVEAIRYHTVKGRLRCCTGALER